MQTSPSISHGDEKIPFLDLDLQFKYIENEINQAIQNVLSSKKFIQGTYCEQFSSNFCHTHGGKNGIGVSNGTSAISVALKTLGVGRGDEVIVPTHTFIASVEGIVEVGATPVLVDCRADTYGMDEALLDSLLTRKTKAIIPVHLYGNPCEMDFIQAFAKKYDLFIIEDCAQAHLAKYQQKPVGTFGEFGTFSFFPGKNLGAYGDAGFIIADSSTHFEQAKKWIDHGRISKYKHEFFSGNYRMDGLQAAILDVKLKYLSEWTKLRRQKAKFYDQVLSSEGFKFIKELDNAECVYHLYVVEVSNREEVIHHFNQNQIDVGVHYPIPVHQQPAWTAIFNNNKNDNNLFPCANKITQRILSLPIYPELTQAQQNRVIENFLKVAKK